jgi:hypothetical protein
MLRRHAAWVAALAVLVFAPVLGLGFSYDDDWTITENVWLERPLGELVRLLASGESLARRVPNATRPFTVVSFWLDRALFGSWAAGYHAHSLAVYAGCAAFGVVLAWQLTRRRSVALFAGVFFVVAPLHVEPVAGINYRGELYAGLGVLGVLACLLRPGGEGWKGTPVAVFLLALSGLLAKESGVALYLLLGLVWLMLPRARTTLLAQRRSLVALAAASAIWAFWRLPLLWHGDDLPIAPDRGRFQQLLRAARFEVQAVRHALLPWDYNPDYFRQPDASVNWLVTLAAIVFAVVVLGRVRATRIPALGVAIALVAPLPSSPLVRPINEFADRYFFVGILGGGLFWGWCAVRLGLGLRGGLDRLFRLVRRSPLGLGLLCAPLAIPSFYAMRIWQDNRSLWTAAIELTPGSARAWLNLSRVQRKAGEREAATRSLEHAIVLVPDYAPALLARVYDDITDKRMQDAREHVAAILAQGLGNARGVSRAVECVKLEAEAARICADRR